MKLTLKISAAALVAMSAPALAQETSDMGGFYAGAIAGYDTVSISDGTDSGSEGDIMYGVVAGYDYDGGTVVAGVELEYSDSSVGVTENDVFTVGDSFSLDASSDFYAGARLGFKASPAALIYLKGGYTTGRVKATYDDGVTSVSESDNLDGYRIGAGVEGKVSSYIWLRAEYRYSDYGEYSYGGVSSGLSADRHQVVVGIVGKF